MSLSVGDAAPDFSTRNQHGEQVSLAGLRGTPVIVVFYPWAFSGICTSELALLRDDFAELDAAGARVLAVSCDAMFTLRAFADAERLEFDLLSDHWPHGWIAQAYGVFDTTAGCSLRGSFVIDAAGVIRWQLVNQIGDAREMVDLASRLADLPTHETGDR